MDLQQDTYSQEEMSKEIFTEEIIRDKVFDECVFTDCIFIGTRFEKCRFLNCKFAKCDLSNIVPMNSEFRQTGFTGCKTIGIDWTKAGKIKELSFTDCLINYSNFRLLKLPKTIMKKCEAKDVDFIETDLNNSDFRNTDFENSIFFKTNLAKADFSGAMNYSIDINNNMLKDARFSLPEAISLLSNLDIVVE